MSTRTRQPLVAGNWKLHGTRESVRELARAVAEDAEAVDCEVAICPVAVHLSDVASVLGKGRAVALGAQDCAAEDEGAWTGEIAASMIAEYGCRYVILGHSERREHFGETDGRIARKIGRVVAAGMVPILCVGETLDEREAGDVERVVGRQLDAALEALDGDALASMVVAYEPVWAIGTGRSASPEQAQEVHAFIRERLPQTAADRVRILYGGSMKPDNAESLLAQPDIDGGLIGSAALDPAAFLAICRAAV